jgi:hypothetical protein
MPSFGSRLSHVADLRYVKEAQAKLTAHFSSNSFLH